MSQDALRRIFAEAYNNPHSDFYRALYAARGFSPSAHFPQDAEEWQALPFLSKDEMVAVPLEHRTFIPKEEVLFYRNSSGTSGRGLAMIPRNFIPDLSYRRKHTQRFMDFLTPHHFAHLSAERAGIQMVDGDVYDFPTSAKLAAAADIDGISAIASILTAFIPHLTAAMDTTRIRYIFLWGERISRAKRELLYSTFPSALFQADYGLAEVCGVGGFSCESIRQPEEFLIHPRSDLVYWELIDPETGARAIDEGEVVLTTLWAGSAFPALRYRTGDLARLVPSPCSCRKESYRVLGRVTNDRITIPGGVITSSELENALWPYRDHIADDFELHIYGVDASLPRFELHISPIPPVQLDLDTIARNIAETLRISPHRTLASAAQDGLLGSFKCALLPAERKTPKKQIRIFTHD